MEVVEHHKKKLCFTCYKTWTSKLEMPNKELSFGYSGGGWSRGGCPRNIQGMHTMADFEVWNEARYDVILGITWLEQVDAWIACKEGAVYGKLQNDKIFCIKCKRFLPNAPMLSC
jgi:hypothetical protein